MLIKCPECGKMISENAVSCPNCGEPINQTNKRPQNAVRTKGRIVSGVEMLRVQGNNRIDLSVNSEIEIKKVTDRLIAEGKTIVNVQRMEPQPISFGVTIWRMDISVVWNADTSSEAYQEASYKKAVSLKKEGKYDDAIKIFMDFPDYLDSTEQIQKCVSGKKRAQEKLNRIRKEEQKREAEQADIESRFGKDPRKNAEIVYVIGGGVIFLGLMMIAFSPIFVGLWIWLGIVATVLPAIMIVGRIISVKKYKKNLDEYYRQKVEEEQEKKQKTKKKEIKDGQ